MVDTRIGHLFLSNASFHAVLVLFASSALLKYNIFPHELHDLPYLPSAPFRLDSYGSDGSRGR